MKLDRYSLTAFITFGALLLLGVTSPGCGGSVPATRYYQLAPPAATPGGRGDLVIAIEPFETDPGYDDERIVYRTTPYRLDYYQYHRWSASPSVMVASFLEQALERAGRFRAVVRDATEQSPLVIRGRVLAIEEVDRSATSRVGRIVVELSLVDSRTGSTLWSEQFEEAEPVAQRTPEGLAKALSVAMGRIAARATDPIAAQATRIAAAKSPEPTLGAGL
ncbi:MAG: ABC-type transport auxiliary lipoprotein family protein [Kofleriaceae bacterium]